MKVRAFAAALVVGVPPLFNPYVAHVNCGEFDLGWTCNKRETLGYLAHLAGGLLIGICWMALLFTLGAKRAIQAISKEKGISEAELYNHPIVKFLYIRGR